MIIAMCTRHYETVQGFASARTAADQPDEEEPIQTEQCQQSSPVARQRPRYVMESPVSRGWTLAGSSEPTCSATQGRTSTSSEYQLSQEGDPLASAIRQIATAAEIPQDQVKFTQQFATLAAATKTKRANVATRIINAVIWSFAPDAPDELLEMINQRQQVAIRGRKMTGHFQKLVKDIAAAYPNVDDRQGRLLMLGIVATHLRFLELEKDMPGLTPYTYKQARRYVKLMKAGYTEPAPSAHKPRYDGRKVQSFISYIVSPIVVTDLPFGHATVTR